MKKNMLKKAEKSILGYLELDSRESFSKIGRLIRKSQQQVSYTVHSLEKREVINNFYAVVDHSKINYNILLFRVYFKLIYTKEETYNKLIDFLIKDPYTGIIEECWGPYDLSATFFARNVSQFNKHIRKIMETFPKHLQNFTVLTTVVNRIFSRKYLNPKLQYPEIFVGGDRIPEKVDDIDVKIMQLLSSDARINSVDLAVHLKTTAKTAINRIKKLQEKKIILGFKPSLDMRKLGFHTNLMTIRYHNITSDMENSFISYLKAHPNIISAVKTLGGWDLEVRLEVDDYNEIRKIEQDIREKFGAMIQHIENLPIYKNYKNNYFPSFLLYEI